MATQTARVHSRSRDDFSRFKSPPPLQGHRAPIRRPPPSPSRCQNRAVASAPMVRGCI
jgi:hypothetical protein